MKFLMNQKSKKTEPQYLKKEQIEMKFLGFNSNIKGLVIHLDNANGNLKSKTIWDTSISFSLNTLEVGFIWFEWEETDKEYEIVLEFNN